MFNVQGGSEDRSMFLEVILQVIVRKNSRVWKKQQYRIIFVDFRATGIAATLNGLRTP